MGIRLSCEKGTNTSAVARFHKQTCSSFRGFEFSYKYSFAIILSSKCSETACQTNEFGKCSIFFHENVLAQCIKIITLLLRFLLTFEIHPIKVVKCLLAFTNETGWWSENDELCIRFTREMLQ